MSPSMFVAVETLAGNMIPPWLSTSELSKKDTNMLWYADVRPSGGAGPRDSFVILYVLGK